MKPIGDVITQATIEVYGSVCEKFLPTPAKIHYLFNLRDISKVSYNHLIVFFRDFTYYRPLNSSVVCVFCVSSSFSSSVANNTDGESLIIFCFICYCTRYFKDYFELTKISMIRSKA